MSLFSRRNSGIFCIETPWDNSNDEFDETRPKSVRPGIDLVTRYHGVVNFNYKTCATMSEFEYHVEDFRKLRKSVKDWYGLLYLAAHGSSGAILFPGQNRNVKLDELGKLMGDTFKGFTIYFGSCSVLSCSHDEARNFLEATSADCIVGYEKDVDWVNSTILDILFINRYIERKKNIGIFWRNFYKEYKALVDKYEMQIFGV